jgi:adenylate cyclase
MNFILNFKIKKPYLLIGLFYLLPVLIFAQNQKISDSLEIVYRKNNFSPHEKLKILKALAESETDIEAKLKYSSELIDFAQKLDSFNYVFSGFLQKGNAFRLKSDLTKAIESYFEAAKIADKNKLKAKQGSINIAIADVYSIMDNHINAVLYYKKALLILDKKKDAFSLAAAQLNLGDEYFKQNKLDSSLYYYNKSGKIFQTLKSDIGRAYNLGNVGLVYAKKGENKKAEKNLNTAINMLTEIGDYSPICEYLVSMSDIYAAKGFSNKAITYALRSLNLAKKYSFKDQISEAYLKLSKLYETVGKTSKSFEYYKKHIVFKDSVNSIKGVQEMANIRTKYEVSQKQTEVNLLNQQKKTQKIIAFAIGIALLLIIILAVGLYKRTKFMQKAHKIIENEKNRSDDLLLNILPEEIALELKDKGDVKAKKFESVSVLFTDFKGFTKSSENLTPEKLVESVDFYFSKFDEIIKKHNLEKIKTIGDAYMCASGLPFYTENHTVRIVEAAREILQFVEESKSSRSKDLTHFDVRIGINSGPVVAGVVGKTKFSYDIWGDTVNVASRMESASEVGKINISEATRNIIKGYFNCIYRGQIEVKNRGVMNMYYVTGKI